MRLSTLAVSAWLTVFTAGSVLAVDAPAESASEQISKGFGGTLILTPDADWKEKWERPEPPHFRTTENVKLGQTIVALAFYMNPATDKDGNIHILCDIRLTRPDGTFSTDMKGEVCAKGPIQGDPTNVRLVEQLIGFVGEATDQPGLWTLEYKLTDVVRDATVNLKASFTYAAD